MINKCYNICFNIKYLKYNILIDKNFDFLNYEYRINELRYIIIYAIGIIGLFRLKIGNTSYNEIPCDKIIKRFKHEYCLLKNE